MCSSSSRWSMAALMALRMGPSPAHAHQPQPAYSFLAGLLLLLLLQPQGYSSAPPASSSSSSCGRCYTTTGREEASAKLLLLQHMGLQLQATLHPLGCLSHQVGRVSGKRLGAGAAPQSGTAGAAEKGAAGGGGSAQYDQVWHLVCSYPFTFKHN